MGNRDGEQEGLGRDVSAGNVAGEGGLVASRGIGDDVHVTEDADGAEREQLWVAGADADEVKRAAHGLITAHCVTGRRGRMAR